MDEGVFYSTSALFSETHQCFYFEKLGSKTNEGNENVKLKVLNHENIFQTIRKAKDTPIEKHC